MNRKRLAVAALAALLSTGSAARAAEEAQPQAQPQAQIDFKLVGPGTGVAAWGIIAWSGLGLGARYTMPLIPGGLLHGSVPAFKKDSIEVEAGLDFVRYSWGWAGWDAHYNVLRPAVGGKWSLWFNDQLAVYPKLEIGLDIAWWSNVPWDTSIYNPPGQSGIYFDAAAGVLYRIASKFDLRAEVGIDGLRAGVAFNF